MVVSILGCGWLGKALGKRLVETNHLVKASVTKQEKLQDIESAGMQSFLVNLNGKDTLDEGSDFWNCEVLLIASNVNLQGNTGYIEGLKALCRIIRQKNISRVIILSSTSVYGETNGIVDESSSPNPQTASAACLLEIEALFQNIEGTQATVMRCGGLVGPGRMPGSFLSGKKNIANGLAPVNLIHLSDCIGILECLLHTAGQIKYINAVAPDHPSRLQFYTMAADRQRLPLPEFIAEKKSWKVVCSNLTETLGYSYWVNDWLGWLSNSAVAD